MSGKGDKPRPVNQSKFGTGWEKVFGEKAIVCDSDDPKVAIEKIVHNTIIEHGKGFIRGYVSPDENVNV